MDKQLIPCRNCGYALDTTETFCPNCGTDAPARTPSDGSGSDTALRFLCDGCHQSVEEETLVEQEDGRMLCPECRRAQLSSQRKEDLRQSRYATKREDIELGLAIAKRTAERFHVEGCFVRLRRGGLLGRVLGQKDMVPLIDLSVGGLQCMTEVPLRKGDAVAVDLLVPAFDTPLELRGAVRWVEEAEGSPRRRVGVRFDHADEPTARHLTALAEDPHLRIRSPGGAQGDVS